MKNTDRSVGPRLATRVGHLVSPRHRQLGRARLGVFVLCAALGASLSVTVSTLPVGAATPPLVTFGISAASESGKTVTITTAKPHGFETGTGVWVSGVKVAGYNGLWTVKSTSTTTFTYVAKANGLKRSSGGSAANGVPKPDALGIRLPWAAGVPHFITQAYGTHFADGVTPDHWNFPQVGTSLGAQDYYALDFGLSQGEAIYPVAVGIVKYAGWGGTHVGCIIVIDHVVPGSTTHVWSEYAHLGAPGAVDSHGHPACSSGATLVSTGDKITTTARPIGAAGTTGNVAPHLHFAVYEDTANHTLKLASGWDGYGQRPTGGIAVIAEPFLGDQVYENFDWWNLPAGTQTVGMTAATLDAPGTAICAAVSSDSCKWLTKGGQTITDPRSSLQFKLEATAPTGIKEVQLVLKFHPNGTGEWPQTTPGWDLSTFTPEAIWPVVAVCTPPISGFGVQTDASGCVWSNMLRANGSATGKVRAADIAYSFPVTEAARVVDWLPLSMPPWPTNASCVPVSMNFNVYDTAGRRKLGGANTTTATCKGTTGATASDESVATTAAANAPKAQVVYLRPAVASPTPTPSTAPTATPTSTLSPGVWRISSLADAANSVAIDPTNSAHVFVGGSSGQIYESSDSAATWTTLQVPTSNPIISVAIDAFSPGVLLASDGTQWVWRSADAGGSWSFLVLPHGNSNLEIEFSPVTPGLALVATYGNGGLFRSTDGGSTWTDSGASQPDHYFITFDRAVLGTVYDGGYFGGGYVNKSVDTGATWASSPLDASAGAPRVLAIDPINDAQLLVGTEHLGMFQSEDSGGSWARLDSYPGASLQEGQIAVTPTAPYSVYAQANGNQVVTSDDFGTTWNLSGTLPTDVAYLAAATTNRIYASTADGLYVLDVASE